MDYSCSGGFLPSHRATCLAYLLVSRRLLNPQSTPLSLIVIIYEVDQSWNWSHVLLWELGERVNM